MEVAVAYFNLFPFVFFICLCLCCFSDEFLCSRVWFLIVSFIVYLLL